MRFLAAYDEEYDKEVEHRGVLPLVGPTPCEKESIVRYAITRALIRGGYLKIRRRRIAPAIHPRKAASIT